MTLQGRARLKGRLRGLSPLGGWADGGGGWAEAGDVGRVDGLPAVGRVEAGWLAGQGALEEVEAGVPAGGVAGGLAEFVEAVDQDQATAGAGWGQFEAEGLVALPAQFHQRH